MTALPDRIFFALQEIHCSSYLVKPFTSYKLIETLDYIIGQHLSLIHILLKAALPYVPPHNKKAMEIILQADNLISLATEVSQNDDEMTLRAAQAEAASTPAVYEKLLLNIKDYCTPAESEVVRMLLNFLHADELFKNYRDFAKTHSAVKSEEYSEKDVYKRQLLIRRKNVLHFFTCITL